jgi:excisionase family DNA binding protein
MKYLTCKDFAKRHGVTIRTVQAWINRGKLKAEKFGRDWMIPEQDKPKDRRKKK